MVALAKPLAGAFALQRKAAHRDRIKIYDRLAPDYDRRHRRWLRHAGGEAQIALEATVRALVTAKTTLLDAGCGTGSFVRSLRTDGVSPAEVTVLDASEAMLRHCADLPVKRVRGQLESLPFDDGAFDMVTCAWALETVEAPDIAIRELCRVVRPGGILCLVFCAQEPSGAVAAWLMRQAIIQRGAGQFLSRKAVIEWISDVDGFDVRSIPNSGPAAALLARRSALAAAPKICADPKFYSKQGPRHVESA